MIDLQRFGFHDQPTVLVLSFSAPVDQARAQDVSNYQVTSLGGPGRGGAVKGQRIAIGEAVYNPITLTVTLYPVERLNVHNRYSLRVNMTTPGGLAGPGGLRFGQDYTAVISRSTLVGAVQPGTRSPILGARSQHPRGPVHASHARAPVHASHVAAPRPRRR